MPTNDRPDARRRWSRAEIRAHLARAIRRWRRWGGTNPAEISGDERAEFDEDYEQYLRAIRRAIKAGGVGSAAVRRWINGQRSLIAYDELRSLKTGLETDLPGRMFDEADLWIALHAADMIDEGKTLDQIREQLLAKIDAATRPDGLVDPRTTAEEAKVILQRLRPAVQRRLGTKQNLQRRLAALGMSTRGPEGK